MKKYSLNSKKKPLPIIESRKCLKCGCDFDINAQQMNKKYCDNCKKQRCKERKKEYYQKNKKRLDEIRKEYYCKNHLPKRHIIICERCKKEFIIGSGRQPTVCIECLKKSDNYAERARANVRRIYSADERIRLSN